MVLMLSVVVLAGCSSSKSNTPGSSAPPVSSEVPITRTVDLPAPATTSSFSLEKSLLTRRSVRDYSATPLTLNEVSQLLWSAQGITSDSGGRTAPSAGGLYPLEVYLITGQAVSLGQGIYRYKPEGHTLVLLKEADVREDLSEAALGQTAVKQASVNIVISAIYERTTQKYGDRGIRYAHMEVGHAAQNICLQAAALNLGAVTIGAFDDDKARVLLNMPANENPLYIIPVGHK
jgi:SagB-type dehydrogenase family enzyme